MLTRDSTRLIAPLLLVALAACETSTQRNDGDDDSGATTTSSGRPYVESIEVITRSGTRLLGTPLRISAISKGSPVIELSVVAGAEGVPNWQALGKATEQDLESGRFVLEVDDLPVALGVANVQRLNEVTDEITRATTGQLVVQLGEDHAVSGSATTDVDDVSADFNGTYILECYVTPEELGQEPNGHGAGPGDVMFIEDVVMESEYCRGLTRWK